MMPKSGISQEIEIITFYKDMMSSKCDSSSTISWNLNCYSKQPYKSE